MKNMKTIYSKGEMNRLRKETKIMHKKKKDLPIFNVRKKSASEQLNTPATQSTQRYTESYLVSFDLKSSGYVC